MKNETNHVEATGRGPFDSLELLCQSVGEIPDGERAYEVQSGKLTKYVVSNSLGQAAISVAKPKVVPWKQLGPIALKVAKADVADDAAEELAGKGEA